MESYVYFLMLVIVVLGFLIVGRRKRHALPGEEIAAKVRYVVDGDSLYLKGYKAQIRLWGVDAPEKNERGFQAATNTLKKLVHRKRLYCRVVDHDHYGRIIARCFLSNGREINMAMIQSGTAKEYRRFTKGFYSR